MTLFRRFLPLALAVLLLCSALPAHAVDAVRAGAGSQPAYREQQTTATVLMVSPDDFGFNAETAGSNLFQNRPDASSSPKKQALKEFDAMVTTLRGSGIRVIRLPSRMDARTPDAVFPNNWFSLHAISTGKRILLGYPMLAPNRRAERRLDQLERQLAADGLTVHQVLDLSSFEQQGKFLEGTGSMVLDRANRITYAALSPRTEPSVLQEFALKLQYKPVSFYSYDRGGTPVYHTNVMMSVGKQFAVICVESIRDQQEQDRVVRELQRTGKEVITITLEQMGKMCGNILELRSPKGPLIVMSQTAYDHFTPEQRNKLQRYGKLLPVQIPTIEAIGGGSARCMLGEVF